MNLEKAYKQRRLSHTVFVVLLSLYTVAGLLGYGFAMYNADEEGIRVLIGIVTISWCVLVFATFNISVIHKNFDEYEKQDLLRREKTLNTVSNAVGVVSGNYHLATSSMQDQGFAHSVGIYKSARNVSCTIIILCNVVLGIFDEIGFYSGGSIYLASYIIRILLLVCMCVVENKWRRANSFITDGVDLYKSPGSVFAIYVIFFVIGYGSSIVFWLTI